jgi:predicted DNA-binding protein with PD1-like motif
VKSKLIHDGRGEKTFAVIFESGDEAMAGLVDFATAHSLGASHFTAIGAFRDVTVGYFDWESKEYRKIPVREQVEVLSLIGDVALKDGQPKVHAYTVVEKVRAGTAGEMPELFRRWQAARTYYGGVVPINPTSHPASPAPSHMGPLRSGTAPRYAGRSKPSIVPTSRPVAQR